MRRQLTFIHAADLHLGAPFRGLRALPESWANRLYNAIPEAYDRVIDAAIQHSVDFVVIAGDVFDTSRPSLGDYLHFFDGLRRLQEADIPVYLCTGNHDPYTSWQKDFDKLPDNTTMFAADKPSFALYERDGVPLCVLGGRSYYNQTWPLDESIIGGITRAQAVRALDDAASKEQAGRPAAPHAALAPFAVGVVHSGLNLDPYKAPANPAEMLAAGMDYWALGHIHKRFQFPSETDPRIVFSGCIQGRDIKETGARGCCLVTLTEGAANKIEFVPTASVVWQRLTVNVEDCRTLADVQSHITRGLFRVNGKAHCEQMLARITLTGSTDLHAMLEREDVRKDICARINEAYPAFYCDVVIDSTCAVRDMAALAEEGLFPSLVLRVANNMREDEQTEFIQEELVRRGIELPNNLEKRLDEYTQTAKNIVLDALMDGGDA